MQKVIWAEEQGNVRKGHHEEIFGAGPFFIKDKEDKPPAYKGQEPLMVLYRKDGTYVGHFYKRRFTYLPIEKQEVDDLL